MVNDISSIVVHDAIAVVPALDLKVGDVGLPHFVDSCGLFGNLFTGLYQYVIGTGNQVGSL